MIIIELEELVKINENIMVMLKRKNQYHFEIKNDFYKFIATDEWNDFSSESTYCVGSLKDDWATLKNNSENSSLSNIDIERYAQIMRALQEESIFIS